MRISGCMEERGEASTAGHKRKTTQSWATHNSKIPVAKCAKSMTAKDFDKIHQKNFERSVSYVCNLYMYNCVHCTVYMHSCCYYNICIWLH